MKNQNLKITKSKNINIKKKRNSNYFQFSIQTQFLIDFLFNSSSLFINNCFLLIMSTKLKYGSLSKNIGRLTKLSSPRKAESPGLKAKKKSDECPSGLKKLSGNK